MSQCPLGGHYISNTNIIPLSSRVCPWSGILRHINLKSLTFPPDLVKTEPSPTSQIRGSSCSMDRSPGPGTWKYNNMAERVTLCSVFSPASDLCICHSRFSVATTASPTAITRIPENGFLWFWGREHLITIEYELYSRITSCVTINTWYRI